MHDQWQTGPWFLRDERCYLIPGDSPLGYRLPLDSQPWAAKSDYPYVNPPDPEMAQAPLASHADYRARRVAGSAARRQMRLPGRGGSARAVPGRSRATPARLQGVGRLDHPPGHVRRAARRQALHLHAADPELDDYLEVVAAIEATAEEMRCR
jgi:uncharacterized protein (DUF2126 family)